MPETRILLQRSKFCLLLSEERIPCYPFHSSIYPIYFTLLREDSQAMEENQRVAQIRLKRLTNEYKESLAIIVQDIIGDININRVRKIIKG